MSKKVEFLCSRPECDVAGSRYPSQIRNPDRLYCSHSCKKADESRFQTGELNSNYKGGKYHNPTCRCGARRHVNSKNCKDCKDTSASVLNISSSQEPSDIFVIGTRRRNQRVISAILRLGLLTYACVVCKNDGTWMGEPITLQLDHINGNAFDNRLENLRFLCPNCHAQTETWGYKGKAGE